MSFGPYAFDTEVGLTLTGQIDLALVSGPTQFYASGYLEDNYGGTSSTTKLGQASNPVDPISVNTAHAHSFTLTAGASGYIRYMLKAHDSSSYMDVKARNIAMMLSVHKR